jgi:hypothetical protein
MEVHHVKHTAALDRVVPVDTLPGLSFTCSDRFERKTQMAKNKEAAVATSKSKCPITREQFQAGAKAMTVSIGNRQVIASPKEFGYRQLRLVRRG